MKKRLLSLCCILILIVGITAMPVFDSHAASELPMIDGSYLTYDDESVGYDTKITRGEDLLTGYSKCVELGPELLYAGGATIAAHKVEEVGIGVVVERAQKGDDHWEGYTTWQEFNESADRVSTSKILEVEGGYYYRVRCVHSAGEDISSSFTDGVYIEEK